MSADGAYMFQGGLSCVRCAHTSGALRKSAPHTAASRTALLRPALRKIQLGFATSMALPIASGLAKNTKSGPQGYSTLVASEKKKPGRRATRAKCGRK